MKKSDAWKIGILYEEQGEKAIGENGILYRVFDGKFLIGFDGKFV